MKLGIIGNGFVGKATQLFKSFEIVVYDIRPEACKPMGTTLNDIDQCDLIFLCLPTPMNHNSGCYTEILTSTIEKLQNPFKIVRSTVSIGFSQSVGCFFMPEFLTEANWENDFRDTKNWIIGMPNNIFSEKVICEFQRRFSTLIEKNFEDGYIKNNSIIYLTNGEAEAVKIIKNTFLSAKVGIMNEIYDFCQAKRLDYNRISDILILDERIGKTHMKVPGYYGKRGFGGTCFPKDTHSLYSQFQELGIKSILFQSVLDRNDNLDRPEREWRNDIWRTTLPRNKPISLVTGGAGFLGSNLCGRLLVEGHTVICLDNFSTGSYVNIAHLESNRDFLVKRADVVDKQFFPHIDYIWHLACPASPPKYQADGYKTLQTSIVGTMNMLDLAKAHGASLLFSSTSEVYGDPLEHPQKETYWGNVNPVGERSCYDEGKRVAETLIYEYRKKHTELADKLKIVRIFNTYGPGMDINDGRVITNYIQCILAGKPITIYGNGQQSRSFCYVDDMIDGFLKMMESIEVGPINIGNPHHEFTMNELVSQFEQVLGRKLETINLPLPRDDPKQRKPDITLARERLGWEPNISLGDGLLKTYLYFKGSHSECLE